MAIDEQTRTELEAAVFRRLVAHLRADRRAEYRADESRRLLPQLSVQLAEGRRRRQGVALSKDESREAVYGMPYETWKATYQTEATPDQAAAMKKTIRVTEIRK
jgi:hypothetical protein